MPPPPQNMRISEEKELESRILKSVYTRLWLSPKYACAGQTQKDKLKEKKISKQSPGLLYTKVLVQSQPRKLSPKTKQWSKVI